jgi:alanyl-tRNA synthetase
VEPERLRFDFTHFSAMTPEEIQQVEQEVNEKILESLDVQSREMDLEAAKKLGATALFGEKYGKTVRVVTVGDYSMELCGGTHLGNTAQAGLVKVLGESGVAAGVRRIEALTGAGAVSYYQEKEKMLQDVSAVLKTQISDSVKKAEELTLDLKNAEKEIEKLRSKLVSSSAGDVLSGAVDVKGVKVVSARYDQLDMEALRNTGDMLKNKLGSCVVVLGSGYGDKVSLVVTATKDVVEKGVHCGNIIREIAKITGGGGGGRPDMAQAGGKDEARLDEALKQAIVLVDRQVK